MRVYGAWIKIYNVLCPKHIAALEKCHNPLLVRDKPLGAPVSVKHVRSKCFIKLVNGFSLRICIQKPLISASVSQPYDFFVKTVLSEYLHFVYDRMQHKNIPVAIEYRVKMYGLEWRIACAVMGVLFWCLIPALRSYDGNKHRQHSS